MKLQNMTVIFIIIMIPIIIVTSYYIGLQIKTITMQKDYTVKLQTAAKDSIQALEINTVEWNSASSNLADSKRRDVLASINTFTTSLANNMGIGGAGKGRIQTYIPAIVYTMYDGYYIYSASLMKDQKTDKDGLTQFEKDTSGKDTGNIKYNTEGTSSYQYILKPYSPYSARYVNGNVDVTVNYTLDNYIRVYGKVGTGDEDKSVAKEGYLVVCDSDEGVKGVTSGRISGIEYRGAVIKPETLKENVYNVYIDKEEIKEYPYIYDQYDNKLYWDGNNYFSVDKYNNKVYLQNALPEGDAGFSITNRFRKISIPVENRQGELTVQKVFQILNPGGGFKFYYENESGAFVEFTSVENIDGSDNKKLAGVEVEKDKDFSAINYCVESYVFTKWVTKNLGNITVGDMQISTGNSINSLKNITSAEQQYYGQYNNVDDRANIFEINDINNNPDPENDDAYAKSVLAQHKKDIIINTIEKNLSQATAQAQAMNLNYEYRLPQLSYDEWEQALSNISIIAFMQGMPIGLKYYNNYAIATSTLNKEFVDPDELYFAGTDDQYYHQRQCEQATGSDYVGYRSIDYVAKSYEEVENDTTKSTKYYYPHANSTNSELECYYCLVNRSTYNANDKAKKWNKTPYNSWTDSYYNALARERYMQLDEPGTYKPNVTVEKKAETTSVEYGGTVKYTITIKNNGIVADTITLVDAWKYGEIELTGDPIVVKSDKRGKLEVEIKPVGNNTRIVGDDTGIGAERIYIEANETITVTYDAYLKGSLGKTIENTAILYSFTNKDIELDKDTATTTVKKTINVQKTEVAQNYNIVLLLDHSDSMKVKDLQAVYSGVQTLLGNDYIGGKLFDNANKNNQSNSAISMINFWGRAKVKYTNLKTKQEIENAIEKDYKTATIFDNLGGTNYSEALEQAALEFKKMGNSKKNILVFFTDGAPTLPSMGDLGAVGYTIHSEENEYYYWTHPLVGISKKEEGGLGEKIWLNGDKNFLGKTIYRGIKEIVDDMKKINTDIYCINYGDDNSVYGLKNIISSYKEENQKYYAYARDEEGVEDAFKSIGNSILNSDIGDINYSPATSNKIKLEKPEEITCIQVGTKKYIKDTEDYNSIIKVENGETYLNLEQIDLTQTITIIY